MTDKVYNHIPWKNKKSRRQLYFIDFPNTFLCQKNSVKNVKNLHFDIKKAPYIVFNSTTNHNILCIFLISGAPSGTRTPDPLIKSQLLYQLS